MSLAASKIKDVHPAKVVTMAFSPTFALKASNE